MATLGDLFKKATIQPTPAGGQLPTYLGGGQQRNYPQAMPGQLEAIAAQLAAGYGGTAPQATAANFMQQMDATYAPMAASAPAAPAAPATPQKSQAQNWQNIPKWMRGNPIEDFTQFAHFFSQPTTQNKGAR